MRRMISALAVALVAAGAWAAPGIRPPDIVPDPNYVWLFGNVYVGRDGRITFRKAGQAALATFTWNGTSLDLNVPLTLNGEPVGGGIPENTVTTNTDQTVTAVKTFIGGVRAQSNTDIIRDQSTRTGQTITLGASGAFYIFTKFNSGNFDFISAVTMWARAGWQDTTIGLSAGIFPMNGTNNGPADAPIAFTSIDGPVPSTSTQYTINVNAAVTPNTDYWLCLAKGGTNGSVWSYNFEAGAPQGGDNVAYLTIANSNRTTSNMTASAYTPRYIIYNGDSVGSQGPLLSINNPITGLMPSTSALLDVTSGASTVLKARNDGKVGIGTGTPTSILHLHSASTTASEPTGLTLGRANGTASVLNNTNVGRISFQPYGGVSPAARETAYIQATTTEAHDTAAKGGTQVSVYATTTGSVTPSEQLRITGGSTALRVQGAVSPFVDEGSSSLLGAANLRWRTGHISNVGTSVAAKTADYTVVNETTILVDATSGNRTITLPAANVLGTGNSRNVKVKKIDASANTVTVTRAGTDTIEGATTVALSTQYAFADLVSDGAAVWYKF